MPELLTELSPWGWISVGFLLGIVELLVTTTIFIWPALAAFLVGIAMFMMHLDFITQILLFLILTVVAALAGRYLLPKFEKISGGRNRSILNDPTRRNIGEIGTVISLDENGGIGVFGGVRWHFRLQEGVSVDDKSIKKVKVVDSTDSLLIVQPFANQDAP
ncbi:MAG: NfeD family protein [Rhodobacteraceae bacterium]|nr:NfeD family protein [Paracoccaceae bacterium]MCY4249282.1 NfeD family protein [Paracoccaceae bacterium]